jgi:uncharacterized membrane protein
MARPKSLLSNERMDWIISNLLRIGVAIAALVVLAGGIYYLARHGGERPNYATFRGEPAPLRTLPGIVGFALDSHSRGLIELGLVLLIATPIARVVFSVVAFALQRDRTYVMITLIVLAVLLYNLIGGFR